MVNLARKLVFLQKANYLQAKLEASNLKNVELLSLGKILREQLEIYWHQLESGKNQSHFLKAVEEDTNLKDLNPRLQFLGTNLFRKNMKLLELKIQEFLNYPVIKTKLNINRNLDLIEQNNVLSLKCDSDTGSTLLIIDQFFHENCGLEKLYNIQRERKIWWMRFSADPSRYYLEPYELFKFKDSIMPNAQSITIKSRLPFGDINVEHITLVPLNEVELENKTDFEIYNKHTKKKQIPAVIRSVINLDVATCALIFDGATNNKREETLFLNRKLTPYQCQIFIEHKDNCLSDLKDLSKHISNVISRAGLRILKNNAEHLNNEVESATELKLADKLGIPYTIILNPDSLKTGLMKLRSRDTTLKETIHISDIPIYLLNIFRAT